MTERLPRGLIQVYTGEGKGKSTAALGQAWRALGAGLRVCFVSFIKGAVNSSEFAACPELLESKDLSGQHFLARAFGRQTSPFIFGGAPTPADQQAVAEAWEYAAATISSGDFDLVILDEINNALHHGLLELIGVLDCLQARPAHVEVICTGRNAPAELLDMADLVTEMRCVKHPFDEGVAARRGIEY